MTTHETASEFYGRTGRAPNVAESVHMDAETQLIALETERAAVVPGGWTIDTDHLHTDEDTHVARVYGEETFISQSRVGFSGQDEKITAGTPEAERFHIFDDDGNLYYSGFLVEPSDGDPELCPWLGALNFAARDAGCTFITGADKSKPVIA
jgi:hypothetical protein